ncbi:unnamed protein product [Vitrella brassicaformis CCMP3155]|uniref:Uncharacterized protein n=1 Tax=Vitrella brassicaformis (strain CCMP3155) TaxID=1169540 RepID=A0A0G4G8L6_VITBC|nr:unnamed protein product [Vitrella brassicaformis CCMP3155]|mmetsp:Transcript_1760/g.3822  ORF Transcript_1760/g.3822 Transcript_1760/m.3822 type:complete len:193 (-) Transcript_1760:638-1216(-)|eukprot:CEM24706.1 unnamed protein product [Vitrella brassicaformis CCMP3155]
MERFQKTVATLSLVAVSCAVGVLLSKKSRKTSLQAGPFSNTTIVTAYFELPFSKHSHEEYDEWMRPMLSIRNEMVIFYDRTSVPKIRRMRKGLMDKTLIIQERFRDFYVWRHHNQFVRSHDQFLNTSYFGKRKPLATLHSPELYMIWHEKVNHLKRAMDENPLAQSSFSGWTSLLPTFDEGGNRHGLLQIFP